MDLDLKYKDSFNDLLLRVTYHIPDQDKRVTELEELSEEDYKIVIDLIQLKTKLETQAYKNDYLK